MPNLLDDFSLEEGPSVDWVANERLCDHIGGDADQLYWAAQPKQGLLLFHKEEGCLSLFFGFIFLFPLAWEILAIQSGAGWLFMLWGIPFVGIGGYLFLGRFIHDAWYRRRGYYGLPETKLYILRSANSPSIFVNTLASSNALIAWELWVTSSFQKPPAYPIWAKIPFCQATKPVCLASNTVKRFMTVCIRGWLGPSSTTTISH